MIDRHGEEINLCATFGSTLYLFASNCLGRIFNKEELLNGCIGTHKPVKYKHLDTDKIELILQACKVKFGIPDGEATNVMRVVMFNSILNILKSC